MSLCNQEKPDLGYTINIKKRVICCIFMTIRFGTSGNPPNFFLSKFGKDRINAVDWINSIGLNAYERLMTYGARMKEEDAAELGRRAKKYDVSLSVHAPYYIVFTSDKEMVVKN